MHDLAPASWHSHRYSVTPISWPGARAPARRAGNICSAPMTTHPGRGKRRNNHMPCSPFASNKEHSATRTLSTFDDTLKQPKGGSSEAYLEKGNAPLLHLYRTLLRGQSKVDPAWYLYLLGTVCCIFLTTKLLCTRGGELREFLINPFFFFSTSIDRYHSVSPAGTDFR